VDRDRPRGRRPTDDRWRCGRGEDGALRGPRRRGRGRARGRRAALRRADAGAAARARGRRPEQLPQRPAPRRPRGRRRPRAHPGACRRSLDRLLAEGLTSRSRARSSPSSRSGPSRTGRSASSVTCPSRRSPTATVLPHERIRDDRVDQLRRYLEVVGVASSPVAVTHRPHPAVTAATAPVLRPRRRGRLPGRRRRGRRAVAVTDPDEQRPSPTRWRPPAPSTSPTGTTGPPPCSRTRRRAAPPRRRPPAGC
jgi:hypothetical protein